LAHVGRVSLNRTEQMIFDYLGANLDEERFWKDKVEAADRRLGDAHRASEALETELWAYLVERSEVVNPFKEQAAREGLPRTSLRNLADHLVRLWGVPRSKKKPPTPGAIFARGE